MRNFFKKQKREQGQMTVFILLSLLPLTTLMAFAINMGMLVHAKIALQNAADLAAYAGAATQARQMTQISHLNYMMRQAYKKFLYRYYVIGNLSTSCFPFGGNTPSSCQNIAPQDGAFRWENVSNSTGSSSGFPGVPVVCLSAGADSNFCQIAQPLPVPRAPQCIPLDPMCPLLQSAAQSTGAVVRLSCEKYSVLNSNILAHWLYGTSPRSEIVNNTAYAGLVNDVGLVTELEMLNLRIKNVQTYVNQKPNTVTLAVLRNLEDVAEPPAQERSIMAFKTARGNLNEDVFEPDEITMRELLPGDGNLLNLKPIPLEFDAFSVFMEPQTTGNGDVCNTALERFQVKTNFGVQKEPNSYVYYAVQLTAKAKLLFNPFPFGNPDDGLVLTAYAAAAPFGSRIGPDVSESELVRVGATARMNRSAQNPTLNGVRVPRLTLGTDLTWEHTRYLSGLSTVLRNPSAPSGGQASLGSEDIQRGLRAALLPEQAELGRYNIPVDSEANPNGCGDPTDRERGCTFETYYTNKNDQYLFWAPLFRASQDASEVILNIRTKLEQQLAFSVTQGGGAIDTARQVARERFQEGFDVYLNELRQGGTDNDLSGINKVSMLDPLSVKYFSDKVRPSVPGKISDASPAGLGAIASSFVPLHDARFYNLGRDGYSVKIIPFKNLVRSPALLSNNPGNTLGPVLRDNFGGAMGDLILLEH